MNTPPTPPIETETIDRLFLELAQVTQATTPKEAAQAKEIKSLKNAVGELTDLLRSSAAIAERKGEGTAWTRWFTRLKAAGISPITPKTFRVLEGDPENE